MRASRALLLVLVILAVGAFAPAAGAVAQERVSAEDSVGIRLLDGPVEREDDPRARVYIVDHLAPGTTIERRIEISNDTAAVTDIELYAAGADVEDGVFAFFEGRDGNELADWTSIDPPTVNIPAGDTAEATVQIDVPPDASEGERYAVVWAELPTTSDGDVLAINRVGIRVYLSVGPGGEPPSDFSIDELTAQRTADGHPTVTARVHNTGGRALDLTGKLTLAEGPGGVTAGPFAAEPTTLGVDQRGEVLVELDPELPDGPWQAVLTLRSGRTEHSVSANLTFPAPGEAETVTPDQSGWAWWLVVVALVVLLAALIWWLLRRRQRSDRPSDAAGRVPA